GEAVAVKVPAGGEPSLPALGAAQLLDGLASELAVCTASLGALLLGEGFPGLGHSGPPWSWARQLRALPPPRRTRSVRSSGGVAPRRRHRLAPASARGASRPPQRPDLFPVLRRGGLLPRGPAQRGGAPA